MDWATKLGENVDSIKDHEGRAIKEERVRE
jgi:hypothetical protein